MRKYIDVTRVDTSLIAFIHNYEVRFQLCYLSSQRFLKMLLKFKLLAFLLLLYLFTRSLDRRFCRDLVFSAKITKSFIRSHTCLVIIQHVIRISADRKAGWVGPFLPLIGFGIMQIANYLVDQPVVV